MGRYILEDENGEQVIIEDDDYQESPSSEPTPTPSPVPYPLKTTPKLSQVGPTFDNSYPEVVGEAVAEFPQSIAQSLAGLASLAKPPSYYINELINNPRESLSKFADIAAPIAGAVGAGALGASLIPTSPLLAAGALGGIGFAGTSELYNLINDYFDDDVQPASNYGKGFTYNLTQALLGEGPVAALRGVVKPLGKSGARASVRQQLLEADPNLATKLDESFQAELADPLYSQRTTAEISDSPQLKALEGTSRRTLGEDGGGYNQFAENLQQRTGKQLEFLEEIAQESGTAPSIQDIQAAIRLADESEVAAKAQGLSELQARAEAAAAELPSAGQDNVPLGAEVRQNIESQAGVKKAEIKDLYSKIKSTNDITRHVSDKLPDIQDTFDKYFQEVGPEPNASLTGIYNDLFKGGAEATSIPLTDQFGKPVSSTSGKPTAKRKFTFDELKAIYSDAVSVRGDRRSVAVAEDITRKIDEIISEAVEAGTLPAEVGEGFKTARAARREFGDVYELKGTPVEKALETDPFGRPKIQETTLLSRLVRKGDKGVREGIRNYKVATNADVEPLALDPVYEYATRNFAEYSVRDGKVVPKRAEQWLRDHSPLLEELPELRDRLSNAKESQRLVDEKIGAVNTTKAEIEKNTLKYVLEASDASVVIERALSTKDKVASFRKLTNYIKGKAGTEGTNGLVRGLVDYLKKTGFKPSVAGGTEEFLAGVKKAEGVKFQGRSQPGTLSNELRDVLNVLPVLEESGALTKSQSKGFKILFEDLESQLSIERAKPPTGSDTAFRATVLNSLLKGGVTAAGGFFSGIPGARVVTEVLKQGWEKLPKSQRTTILENALLDRKFARDLLNPSTPKNLRQVTRALLKEFVPQTIATAPANQAAQESRTEEKTPRSFSTPNPNRSTGLVPVPQFNKDLLTGLNSPVSYKDFLKSQPPLIRALASVESSNDPTKISPKGAQGFTQLMPATALEIANKLGETYTPLRSDMTPEEKARAYDQNLRFGRFYLEEQQRKYKNLPLSLAAYNAGPGRVDQAIQRAGSRSPVQVLKSLPPGVQAETIPYVKKVLERLAQESGV